ncbi:glycosyltransferase family 39 protein [Homoserinibacter sp. GY 40078]|uniref:glycosyltransferase family 39 protein n=1 Tax=Homoserinibacter sp. GY 40078 TaxID=2603275 RepID=UPI00164FC7BB|nr:glycosyltransferase family 39 protein [Homoserinibacter sp. GY 40078]
MPSASGGFPTSRVAAVLVAAPLGVVVVAAAFLSAGVATAAGNVFTPWLTLPVAIVLAVLGLLALPRNRPTSWAPVLGAIAALVVAVVWVLAQIAFPTEFVRPTRDPGLYTIAGTWLAQHGGPSIDVSSALATISGHDGFTGALGGFVYESPDQAVHLQGGDGAPSIVAYGVWLGGTEVAIRMNLIVGGVALLAVYELSRRLIRNPAFALVPVVLLGASMPFIYLSRAPYTEIATTAFFAAGAAVLIRALRSGRRLDLILAGALSGVGCMTRIDTALPFAMLIVGFGLLALGFASPPPGIRLSRAFLYFAVPGWVLGLVGVVDVLTNYRRYVSDLSKNVYPLWAVTVLITVVVLVLVLVHDRRGGIRFSPRAARGWWIGASIAAVGLLVFWLSRPAWLISHLTVKEGYQRHVVALQNAAGVAVDETRSYDEYSLWWFAWYFGWPLLIGVAVGLVLFARRIFLDRDSGALMFITLTLGTGLLYITRIAIAPDQLWAYRRVMPVITPGFLILAAAALAALWAWKRGRWWGKVAAAVGVVVLLAGVRISWTLPLYNDIEFSGQLTELEQICDRVEGHDLVVTTGASGGVGLSIRAFCGADVAALTIEDDPVAAQQALAGLVADGVDVVVVTEHPDRLVGGEELGEADIVEPILRWDNVLFGAPERAGISPRSTWVAGVSTDGSLVPAADR